MKGRSVFLVIAIILTAAAVVIKQHSARKDAEMRAELQADCQKAAEAWMKNAIRVATSAEAIEAVRYVESNSAPAFPTRGGNASYCLASDHGKEIMLIPLRRRDASLGGCWKQYATQVGVGQRYLPTVKAVVINVDFESGDDTAGFLALHECFHALHNHKDPSLAAIMTNARQKAQEEATTYAAQNRNTQAFYGERYNRLLEARVSQMRQKFAFRGLKIDGQNYPPVETYPELDALFGRPKSEIERALRDTHFWVDVYFTLVDRNYVGADKETAKARFIQEEYTKAGLID